MTATATQTSKADAQFLRRIFFALVVATFGAMATGTIAGVVTIQSADTGQAKIAKP